MTRLKKFKVLKRQQAVVYLNPKIKAYDILSAIKKTLDRHRVLVCIQTLMKRGKSEKALKIIHEVVYNLFKDESERRSKLGGLYYIIDGIKRLEHVLFIMPIKKKGRVRYKKAKFLNQQKSISRAVQLLIKHAQQKVFETQQSYTSVLTQEFKDLYRGISSLYKKNDEVYQEIITLRYRRKYEIRAGVYLAKYRKKRELYALDRKKTITEHKYQQVRRLKKQKKLSHLKKKKRLIKRLALRVKFQKLVRFMLNKTSRFLGKEKYQKLELNKCLSQKLQIRKFGISIQEHFTGLNFWSVVINYLFFCNKPYILLAFLCYHLLNCSVVLQINLKKLIFLFSYFTNKNLRIFRVLALTGAKFLQNATKLWLKEDKQNIKVLMKKFQFHVWLQLNRSRVSLTKFKIGLVFMTGHTIFLKKLLYNTLDYYYILMYKYQKHFLKRLLAFKKIFLINSVSFFIKYKKKRHNLYKHKIRGLKFPNTRKYSKRYLQRILFMVNAKTKFFTKDIKNIINEVTLNLKVLKVKKLYMSNSV